MAACSGCFSAGCVTLSSLQSHDCCPAGFPCMHLFARGTNSEEALDCWVLYHMLLLYHMLFE